MGRSRCQGLAPEALEYGGKYYFFAPVGGKQIGVAVSDSPSGPSVDVLGKPLVETPRDANAGDEPIDPAVFVDKDQRIYLYFGTRVPKVVELAKDLTHIVGSIKNVAVKNFPANSQYGEAPFLHAYKGKTFLFYYDNILTGGGDYKRSILMEEISYSRDGKMQRALSKVK